METAASSQSGTANGKDQPRKIINKQKENKMIFIEYETALSNGHFMTICDRFRNIFGRIHRHFNPETKKFLYKAYDQEGNPLFQPTEKLYELKRQFLRQKQIMMEKAHQQRIAKKMKRNRQVEQTLQYITIEKQAKRNKAIEQKTMAKPLQEKNINRQSDRQKELEDLRENKEQNREQEISR